MEITTVTYLSFVDELGETYNVSREGMRDFAAALALAGHMQPHDFLEGHDFDIARSTNSVIITTPELEAVVLQPRSITGLTRAIANFYRLDQASSALDDGLDQD